MFEICKFKIYYRRKLYKRKTYHSLYTVKTMMMTPKTMRRKTNKAKCSFLYAICFTGEWFVCVLVFWLVGSLVVLRVGLHADTVRNDFDETAAMDFCHTDPWVRWSEWLHSQGTEKIWHYYYSPTKKDYRY